MNEELLVIMKLVVGLYIFALLPLRVQATGSPCGGGFSISGSAAANRLARKWAKGYQSNCPETTITIQDTSSSTGVAQVCGLRRDAPVVDVASTSRVMNRLEASSANGWQYQCELSTRKTVQIDFGFQGAALATTQTGPASDCLERLGGLSFDQLRWMFSSMTDLNLVEEYDGWVASEVLLNSDGNSSTRLWSELHEDCQAVEISIFGYPESSPVHTFFSDKILRARREIIDQTRFQAVDTIGEIVNSLQSDPGAIAFFNLRHVLSLTEQSTIANLRTVPILDESRSLYVRPSSAVFDDVSYRLKSGVFFNVNDEEKTWDNLRPFLEYAFSERGIDELLGESFWPIPEWQQMVMKTRAQTISGIAMKDIICGKGDGSSLISIAGSSTVFPISQLWSAVFSIGCNVRIELEGGGSSAAAGRVCGNLEKGDLVDIGNMSREWKTKEASVHEGFIYECLAGDTDRSAIQIPVAVDGLTVAVDLEGAASECIKLLEGLTTDQLRWIFSSYSEEHLLRTGWNPSSISNNDGDPNTHLWSEIDERCQKVEIRLSGPDTESGTYTYFTETILSDYKGGEQIAHNRTIPYFASKVDEDLVRFLNEYVDGISFFGFAYFYQFENRLLPIPIQNTVGEFVSPSLNALGAGSYQPLSRNIYMNILNSEKGLERAGEFIKFGLMTPQLTRISGYVPPSKDVVEKSMFRLDNAPYQLGETKTRRTTFIAALIFCSIVAVTVAALFFKRKSLIVWFSRICGGCAKR